MNFIIMLMAEMNDDALPSIILMHNTLNCPFDKCLSCIFSITATAVAAYCPFFWKEKKKQHHQPTYVLEI